MWKYLLLVLVFLVSCSSQYHEHFVSEHPKRWYLQDNNNGILSGEVRIFPNDTGYDFLLDAFRDAKSRIWIEIYTWTDIIPLTQAVIDAKNRGVDVRVLLEPNVYGTPTINQTVAKRLREANITITYSDAERYTFTHAKFWIVDDVYYISTGNWTKSSFSKNREYIYTWIDVSTLKILEKIFESDTTGLGFKDTMSIPAHLVISPLDARSKILQFIHSTTSEIFIFVQSLEDSEIIHALQSIQNEGKKVHICTADNDSNHTTALSFSWLEWKFSKNPYLHAKAILIDGISVFIWSQNLTQNAIDNNREVGIILSDRSDIVSQIIQNISHDCQ